MQRRKSNRIRLFALLAVFLPVVSCGSGASAESPPPETRQTAPQEEVWELPDKDGSRDNTPLCLVPTMDGTVVLKNELAEIDCSNAAEGYIFAHYLGENPKVKLLIQVEGGKQYYYDLPADARYFAIRNVTEGGFVLMIDNISYTPGFTDLELMGYNVYRDGVKLNGEPVETLTFTDNSAEAGGCYGVTAVYDFDGESAMVTAQSTLGIGTMRDEQCTMNNGRYYDLQGRRLQTTPRRGVYMLKQGQSVKKVIGE